jgi:hypothetical protein
MNWFHLPLLLAAFAAAGAAGSCAAAPPASPAKVSAPVSPYGAGFAGTVPAPTRSDSGEDSAAADRRRIQEAIDRAQGKLREFDNQRMRQ